MDKFVIKALEVNTSVSQMEIVAIEALLKKKEEINVIAQQIRILSTLKKPTLTGNLLLYAVNCLQSYQLTQKMENNPKFAVRSNN